MTAFIRSRILSLNRSATKNVGTETMNLVVKICSDSTLFNYEFQKTCIRVMNITNWAVRDIHFSYFGYSAMCVAVLRTSGSALFDSRKKEVCTDHYKLLHTTYNSGRRNLRSLSYWRTAEFDKIFHEDCVQATISLSRRQTGCFSTKLIVALIVLSKL